MSLKHYSVISKLSNKRVINQLFKYRETLTVADAKRWAEEAA